MLTKWQENTIVDLKLSLPKLQKGAINLDSVELTDTPLIFSVSQKFADVWINGPKNQTNQELLNSITILGKTFCDIIFKAQGKSKFREKTGADDLVTEIDTGIEMLFRIWITKFLPYHKVIGEEGDKPVISTEDYIWYLDPVDGTNNYVKSKKEVGLNLACFKGNIPQIAFLGLPFYHRYFYGLEGQVILEDKGVKNKLVLPSEIKLNTISVEPDPKPSHDIQILYMILDKQHLQAFRAHCCAFILAELLLQNTQVFYKDGIKIWDIAAPLALLKFINADKYDFLFYFPNDYTVSINFFENNEAFFNLLNEKHKTSAKLGLILVYPKNQPEIKNEIINAHQKCVKINS